MVLLGKDRQDIVYIGLGMNLSGFVGKVVAI